MTVRRQGGNNRFKLPVLGNWAEKQAG